MTMSKRGSKSIARTISLIITLMVFVSATAVGVLGYVMYRQDSISLGGERALSIAQAIAAGIDGDNMQQVLATGEKNDLWEREKTMADDTAVATGTAYLYVLDADITTTSLYYMEGYNPAMGDDELDFGATEDASIYAEEMLQTAKTGQPTATGAYLSGEFGNMVSGFAPIYNSAGKVVGVVGADITIDDVLAKVNSFGLATLVIVLAAGIVFGAISIRLVNRLIGKPIRQLTVASGQIAAGDLDIELAIHSQNEIGLLAASFGEMAQSTKNQVDLLEQISRGDLTVYAQPRSDKDQMSHAMNQTVDNLNDMFSEIQASAEHLNAASGQIANSAQILAQGSTDQSATIADLQDGIEDVADKAMTNVEVATRATQLVGSIKENAETGTRRMNEMLKAVQQIDEASNAISTVVKTIDEIASQTNILSLNAAVEAARAGQHGKGFAVVAEEVRNLAAKSAESAQKTARLIEDSLGKTALGVRIANETSSSFQQIVEGINESGQLIGSIAQASQQQSEAVSFINSNIEQVSGVAQQNSATSEESAAASQELNGQSQQLSVMLGRFRLRRGTSRPQLQVRQRDARPRLHG